MIDALKKLDKKFLIIAGCLIILPIVLIIFLAIIQSCGNRKLTYENYEKKMVSSAEKYFKDNDAIPTKEGENSTVRIDKLVEEKYIKSPEKALGDNTCKGSVTVRRNGASIEQNGEGFLSYTYTLDCEKYSTVHLADKIKENIVTEESGLYKVGDEYIFKGDKPKNYITFFGKNYRIMGIDRNGIVKLIKDEPEITRRMWDNKYNTEVNKNFGKNIYKDSLILTNLINDYKNEKKISKDAKKKIVAYNVCIGKRKNTDFTISKELDCSEVLENQVISLISISDYALASLDTECKTTVSNSCNNYNYLYNMASSTWTLSTISNNTYESIFVSAGMEEIQNSNNYNEYNIVIYIDGDMLYQSGNGTLEKPYVIN